MQDPARLAPSFGLIGSDTTFSVAEFQVAQQLSRPFQVSMLIRAGSDFDLEATVGRLARFDVTPPCVDGTETAPRTQAYRGFVVSAEDAGGDEGGHRLFQVVLAPRLWALSQNRNHRVFQQITEIDIAKKILDEWKIPYRLAVDPSRYRPLPYRIQYAESDLAFVHRNLEAVGVSYALVEENDDHVVVLMDEPQSGAPRRPLIFREAPAANAHVDWASGLGLTRRVRPGSYVVQDLDDRRTPQALRGTAHAETGSIEDRLERFHYAPGKSHRIIAGAASETPAADDKGAVRADERFGQFLAQLRLEAKQADRWQVGFHSNALDLRPGDVVPIQGHDRPELAKPVLVTTTSMHGSDAGTWGMDCGAALASVPFRPLASTPEPRAGGMESASVVGPKGQPIHTDELGRVRVQFHWDREGKRDEGSSCWVPVSQSSAGPGYGAVHLPRVGQEVLVDFLGGDLDKPVITGRVFSQLHPLPYRLPEHMTKTVVCRTQTVGGEGYNEIVAEDAAGRQVLGFHAERDLESVVKNDTTETVGGRWRFDALPPGQTASGGERSGLTWRHEDLEVEIGPAKIVATHEAITLSVGDGSSIVIRADKIAITAPLVEINGQSLVDVHGGTIQLNC